PPPPRARASRRPPRYPPDVNKDPGAEERFKEVNEAYHVLADPDTRARYDRFGPDFRQIPEGAERAWAGTGSRRPGGRAAGRRGGRRAGRPGALRPLRPRLPADPRGGRAAVGRHRVPTARRAAAGRRRARPDVRRGA